MQVRYLASRNAKHKARENHSVYLRCSSGIGPNNTYRAEASGSGDMEFNVSEFRYQVTGKKSHFFDQMLLTEPTPQDTS
jgi:hypothetical protein